MTRDYTKYNVEGLGENLNKRKLVISIVKDWVKKNQPSYEELKNIFPDEIQGSKGVIQKESDVKDAKRFDMKEPITLQNNIAVVVCNQWGSGNINSFINIAERLGYNVIKSNSNLKEQKDNANEEKSNSKTMINNVKIIIRDGENPKPIEECNYFDLNVSDLQLTIETPFTFAQYENLVKSILDNETKIPEIQSILSSYSLTYDWLPQFWVVSFDDLSLEPLFKHHFDYDKEQIPSILEIFPGIEESDIEDYMDDFVSDYVYSVEGFGEEDDW